MDKDWLETQLAAGRSIESIAREVGKHPSTVGYWVEEARTRSRLHAAKHAARGGVRSRDARRARESAACRCARSARRLGWAIAAVQYWLTKYELKTEPDHYSRPRRREDAVDPPTSARRTAGRTRQVGRSRGSLPLSRVCGRAGRRVPAPGQGAPRRGGGRPLCRVRIRRYAGALQFHHIDPSEKRSRSRREASSRTRGEQVREEARKCVLLCAKLPRGGRGGARAIRPPSRYSGVDSRTNPG